MLLSYQQSSSGLTAQWQKQNEGFQPISQVGGNTPIYLCFWSFHCWQCVLCLWHFEGVLWPDPTLVFHGCKTWGLVLLCQHSDLTPEWNHASVAQDVAHREVMCGIREERLRWICFMLPYRFRFPGHWQRPLLSLVAKMASRISALLTRDRKDSAVNMVGLQ